MLDLSLRARGKPWQVKAHAGLAALGLRRHDPAMVRQHLTEAMFLSRAGGFEAYWTVDLTGDAVELGVAALAAGIEPEFVRRILLNMGSRFVEGVAILLPRAAAEWRATACDVLGAMDREDARSLLQQFARDRNHRVSRSARRGLTPCESVPPLKVLALGPFEVVRGNVRVPPQEYPQRKVRMLLKYLVCFADRECPAEQIVEALWPDRDDAAGAAQNLYSHVSMLRSFLNPGRQPGKQDLMVLSTGRGYMLRTGEACWLDCRAFEEAVAEADRCRHRGHLDAALTAWERACSLYRGDFLEEDPCEEWALERRMQLHRQFRKAMLGTARGCGSQGRHQEAIAAWQRLLEVDAFNEEAQRAIVCSHFAIQAPSMVGV